MRFHVHSPPLIEYILKKTQWQASQFDMIDWKTYHAMFKSLSPNAQVNWIKLIHNWQNTEHQKFNFKQSHLEGQCPFQCGEQETTMHFCECRAELPIASKQHHLQELNQRLTNIKTCPTLQRAVIDMICEYCFVTSSDPFVPSTSGRAHAITTAIHQHQQLQVCNFLKGRIHSNLFYLQLSVFEHQPSPKCQPRVKWQKWKKDFLLVIVSFPLKVWSNRNAIVHGNNPSKSDASHTAHIERSVHNAYLQQELEPDHKFAFHFHKDINHRLKEPLPSLRSWLQRLDESKNRQMFPHLPTNSPSVSF